MGRSPDKLAQGQAFGVDLPLPAAGRSPWEVRREFRSLCRKNRLAARSGWKIFEMSGTQAGQETALELLAYGGMLLVAGVSPEPASYHISRLTAYAPEVRRTSGCPPEHYPYVLDPV